MFKCQECGVSIGPKKSPVRLTVEIRETHYTNEVRFLDENLRPKTEVRYSDGAEIEKEIVICRACAGIQEAPEPAPADLAHFKVLDRGFLTHTSGKKSCKKVIDDCRSCKGIIDAYSTFPLPVLSKVLEDKVAPKIRSTFAAVAVENLISRSTHNSKRGKADFETAYALMKNYEQKGGSL